MVLSVNLPMPGGYPRRISWNVFRRPEGRARGRLRRREHRYPFTGATRVTSPVVGRLRAPVDPLNGPDYAAPVPSSRTSRIWSSERRIRRETCICEIPTRSAISRWVRPS